MKFLSRPLVLATLVVAAGAFFVAKAGAPGAPVAVVALPPVAEAAAGETSPQAGEASPQTVQAQGAAADGCRGAAWPHVPEGCLPQAQVRPVRVVNWR